MTKLDCDHMLAKFNRITSYFQVLKFINKDMILKSKKIYLTINLNNLGLS